MIERITGGGLAAFKQLYDEQKAEKRTTAINTIKEKCRKERKTGIVAGHFMLLSEDDVLAKIDTQQIGRRTLTSCI